MKDVLDLLEALLRDRMHDDALPGHVYSPGSQDFADSLELLESHGRFKIIRKRGYVVYGYWVQR